MNNNTAQNYTDADAREWCRCFESFLRFVTAWCWIEEKNEGKAVRFNLWPAQIEVIEKFKNLLVIILKARQLGLTWLVAAYCLWLAIMRPLQLIVIISSKEDTAKEFLGRIRFILTRLPGFLVPDVARETTEELEFVHLDRKGHNVNSVIKSLPTTKSGAQSKTPTLLVIDEAHESRDVGRLYAASRPGIEAAGGQVIVIANSVKDTGGWPWVRSLFVGAMSGMNDWVHVFLPWWAHPGRSREQVIDESKHQPIARFKLEQLRGGMDAEDFSQHYPETAEEAISIIGGSYFGGTLKRHTKTRQGIRGNIVRTSEGIEFTEDQRGILEVWRFPYASVRGWDGDHWSRRYCMGSDVSEGLGQSYSVAYVLDRHLDEIVARVRTNRMDAHTWADLLHLVSEWYSSARDWTRVGGVSRDLACICVERTGAGQTTVKRLKDLGANQYVTLIEGQIGGGPTKTYGWQETQQGKHDLSEDLRNWFRVCRGTIYDAVLIDEASTWIKHEGSQRLGPEEGHLGDCVIAAGLTLQASHFVGGSPQRVKAPDTGWMAKHLEKQQEQTGWTV